jgi:hypothetical protein
MEKSTLSGDDKAGKPEWSNNSDDCEGGGQTGNPSWPEQRAEGYEPDCPSVYAQSNGEYGETQEVTGP